MGRVLAAVGVPLTVSEMALRGGEAEGARMVGLAATLAA